MNFPSRLAFALAAMCVLGQPLPPAASGKSTHPSGPQDFEENLKNASRSDTQAANRVLNLATRKDLKALLALVHSSRSSNERLFAGYILYRLSPAHFRSVFTATFPINDSDVGVFLLCASSLPYNKERETECVERPGVKWRISFWDVEAAMLECVKAGDPEAVLRFFCLEGTGDGEYGEGISSDFMDLYVEHPDLVVKFWGIFRNHIDYLRGMDDWYDAETKEKTKARYRALLTPKDPKLKSILAEIDHPI